MWRFSTERGGIYPRPCSLLPEGSTATGGRGDRPCPQPPRRLPARHRRAGPATLPQPVRSRLDLSILEGHLEQSAHLMASLKLSMACWMVASEAISRRKLAAARVRGVATVAGGGSFEVALGRDGCRPTSTSAPTWGSPTSRPARGSPTSPSIRRRSCGWPADAASSCSSSSVASTADRLPRRRSRPWSRTATAGWTPGRSSW
jgi:hypothetical protein